MITKKWNNKGITLIALIVTVIVILILAGIIINSLSGDIESPMEKAQKARFLDAMGTYKDELNLYLSTSPLENFDANGGFYEISTVNVGLEYQPEVEIIIKSIKDEHKKRVIVQNNKLYYYYTREYGDAKEVYWCFENGIDVWNYASYEDFLEDIQYPAVPHGEYIENDGIFVCAPELKGFSKNNTYYVTYENLEIDEPTLTSIKEEEPTWYNYSSSKKQWANIATQNTASDGEELTAYFVWIPRYIYVTHQTADIEKGIDSETVEIRFVSQNNIYRYRDENGEIQQVEYRLKDTTSGIMQERRGNSYVDTEFRLPEAFWWDNNNDGKINEIENLPGYWVSKYEISKGTVYGYKKITDCIFSTTDNSITLEKIKTHVMVDGVNVMGFDVYVDDAYDGTAVCSENESDGKNGANLNYSIKKSLQPNTNYTIKIVAKTSTGNELDEYVENVKTNYSNIEELTKPNLLGFNGFEGTANSDGSYTLTNTYYVTYDLATNQASETVQVIVDSNGNPINIPQDQSGKNIWYNYENKQWANIVTKNTVNGVEKKAYFVWIPRYEYKVNQQIQGYTSTNSDIFQQVEIRFIPKTDTEASDGYKIPEAFWWDNNNNGTMDDGENLQGYWVTKYEISQ
ncbi:MAG: hypothetical protein J5881_00085 [Clostridia bacterium]|nr:hypothetical protein [Clostridia bacterium]